MAITKANQERSAPTLAAVRPPAPQVPDTMSRIRAAKADLAAPCVATETNGTSRRRKSETGDYV